MEEKFLKLITEVLEIEDRAIKLEDKFKEFDEWDSLANLSLVALLDDEFGVVIDTKKLKEINTLQELFEEVKSLS
jgi:acyl carrier protein